MDELDKFWTELELYKDLSEDLQVGPKKINSGERKEKYTAKEWYKTRNPYENTRNIY